MAAMRPQQAQPVRAEPTGRGNLNSLIGWPDGQLLDRFATGHDEAAFAELVNRHGGMVLGICRRVLGKDADAEDAFQATFLVLARKASMIRKAESLAGWLSRIAYRTAKRLRVQTARRHVHESRAQAGRSSETLSTTANWQELRPLLDEEVDRLPEKYRLPIVLCYLENRTNDEAAAQLGWTRGTVAGRLSRARDLLRGRLQRRGVVLSAAALTALVCQNVAQASVSSPLALGTIKAAALTAAGKPLAAGLLSAQATALADATIKSMSVVSWKGIMAGMAALATLSTAVAVGIPNNGVKVPTGPTGQPVMFAVLSPDGRSLVTGGADGANGFAQLWDLPTRKQRAILPGHEGWVTSASFSPDGSLFATASFDYKVRLWKTSDGTLRTTLEAHPGGVDAVAFSADGRSIFTVGGEHKTKPPHAEIKRWDTATGQLQAVLSRQEKWIRTLAVSPDGATLAWGAEDGSLKLWDVQRSQERAACVGHTNGVRGLSFSPDGTTLASASRDGTVKLWDTTTGTERATLHATIRGKENQVWNEIWTVAFSPDGATLASAGDDKVIRLWDMATRKEIATLQGHRGWITSVAFGKDGRTLVSTDWEGTIQVWDIATRTAHSLP